MPVENSTSASVGQRVAFSTLTTCLILAVAEIGARLVLPDAPRPMRPFVEVDPFLPDPVEAAALVTNPGLTGVSAGFDILQPQRFLVHKPPGVLRVLLVGGSSVFQLQSHVPDLRLQLAQRLGVSDSQVEVVNGGANGQGSAGVRHVVEFMLDKDVDAVVVYSGHNEYTEHLIPWGYPDTWMARAERVSAVARGVQLAADAARLAWVRGAPEGATSAGSGPREEGRSGGHGAAVLELMKENARQVGSGDEVTRRYRANLEAMVDEARGRGWSVVLATVPSNLFAPSWAGRPPESVARFGALQAAGELQEAAAFADDVLSRGWHFQSTHLENDVLRDLGRTHEVYLADVQAAVVAASPHGVPGETLFLDHCHLDVSGRQIWVDTVVPVLAEALAAR